MATVTKTNATVSSITKSGSAWAVVMDCGANPSPPPAVLFITLEPGDYLSEFQRAENYSLPMDFTYDDTNGSVSSTTVKKKS